jgi:hypothetical protein
MPFFMVRKTILPWRSFKLKDKVDDSDEDLNASEGRSVNRGNGKAKKPRSKSK